MEDRRGSQTSEGKGFYAIIACSILTALGLPTSSEAVRITALVVGGIVAIGYAWARTKYKLGKSGGWMRLDLGGKSEPGWSRGDATELPDNPDETTKEKVS